MKEKKLDIPENVIEDLKPSETKAADETNIVSVKAARLRVRKAASTDSDVISVVEAGTKLLVDDKYSNPAWKKITTTDGKKGFVMSEHVI